MRKYYVKDGNVHHSDAGIENDCGVMYDPEEVDARIEMLESALQRIVQWSEAYPLDVFPEPDFKAVQVALLNAGLSLDCVSASNMRHVITGVGKIAKEVL
jgi:hypothetical protein